MAIVGIDAVPLQKLNGGIGYYIFYLLDELVQQKSSDRFILYAFSERGDIAHFKKYKNVTLRSIPFLSMFHSLWCQTTLAYALYRDKIDIFWGTTQSIPLVRRKRMKTILTVYDFVYLLFSQTMGTCKSYYLKWLSPFMLKGADVRVPISKGTGSRLLQHYGLSYHFVLTPPIRSTLQYRSEADILPKIQPLGLSFKNYLLTVGTLEPRKNFGALVETYVKLLQRNKTLPPLVIVGSGGWKNEGIILQLQKAQWAFPRFIKVLGHASDADLSYYLSGARYYITFSLYEGYGMPLAEARMCRTSIICYDQPELREAAEDDGFFLRKDYVEEDLETILGTAEIATPRSPQYTTVQEKARRLGEAMDRLL